MRPVHFPAAAHWHAPLHRHTNSAFLHDWLTHTGSLTERLIAQCGGFRVERLHQHRARCLADEADALGLAYPQQVMERDVLLRCHDAAVVYAHTVLPLDANARQWPLFSTLGNRSLGTLLFRDPLVRRGGLQFARLRPNHPLMQRIHQQGLGLPPTRSLMARRSRFTRQGSNLLVTEVFLPALAQMAHPTGRAGRFA